MVAADYYDGRSARAHPVRLSVEQGQLVVRGADVRRATPLSELHVSEPMGAAPRLVKFPDGAHCAVLDHAGIALLLAGSGHRDSWVVRMQGHWRWALVAVLVAMAVAAGAYRWGLPAISEWLAFRVPEALLARLGGDALSVLDGSVLAPSSLPRQRQQELQRRFLGLAVPGADGPQWRIVHRDGGPIGANALALPGGTIVLTDQLVALAADDEEILAVLAHELGHVRHRHSLRMLIQGSVVGLLVAWYVGDVSSVAAGIPTLLLQAGYSRDHEREADSFATAMLRLNGLSPAYLGAILSKLEVVHRAREREGGRGALDYFSSHPATRERIERISAP